jgi:hypothetical protein
VTKTIENETRNLWSSLNCAVIHLKKNFDFNPRHVIVAVSKVVLIGFCPCHVPSSWAPHSSPPEGNGLLLVLRVTVSPDIYSIKYIISLRGSKEPLTILSKKFQFH